MKTKSILKLLIVPILVFMSVYKTLAQTGSASEPVRYIGGVTIDPNVHEGRLRYAVGTESIQVLRANRTHPEQAEDYGWTYNHAPNLAYWNETFFLQYLSNPQDEHVAPGHTLLATSNDGRHWGKPKVIFPHYKAPKGVTIPEGYEGYMMHQRMGFYVAPNGRLLVLGFYGHTRDPFGKGGIGRVVREVKKDGSFGPIYFIRYSTFTDFNEKNTSYPFYKKSKDKGFIESCESLLADRLKTLQWLDEDYGKDDFYGKGRIADSLQAFSYFHRKDGKLVGLWKFSAAAISEDEGQTFSYPVKISTLLMAGGKNWGQKTDDDRFAMVYNPIEIQEYRYPLTVITSDDGMVFDDMLLVQGEVPPRRFYGIWKDFGPCYTRGIVEGNGNPPGEDMWLTYSMNKEDIWVSKMSLPIRYKVEGEVQENFDQLSPDSPITDWNIYSPKWAYAKIVKESNKNNVLQLADKDPYDYSRAIRVFEEGEKVHVKCRVMPKQSDTGTLEIDVVDRYGNRPVRIHFKPDGKLVAFDGAKEVFIQNFQVNQWYDLKLTIDATPHGNYSLAVNGKEKLSGVQLCEAVKSVERISFRTGQYRILPTRKTPNEDEVEPLEGADESVKEASFWIDNVEVTNE